MSLDHWLFSSSDWSNHKSILSSNKTQPTPDLTTVEIIENSSKFPITFPIETVRCEYLRNKIPPEILEKNINSAYPVIHENALFLCSIFLNHQKTNRKNLFYKKMALLQFIDRLLNKRAVMFVGEQDNYLLLDGTRGQNNWEKVGKGGKDPLTLDNCLSYDEIKLSALLSVSSYSIFINNGDRHNRGVYENNDEAVERSGVIVGQIGARLEKKYVMEYNEIVKCKKQNTHEFGYGGCFNRKPTLQRLFMEFYDDSYLTFEELMHIDHFNRFSDRYVKLGEEEYFDKLMYERRITLSIDVLLVEANQRAKDENKRAFVHVVGLGLGVWKVCQEQDRIFMDTFAKRLEFFGRSLSFISDINFAYINHKMAGSYKDGDCLNGITLHFSNRNPQEKLSGDHEGKLLVVSYAWDGNAFPGNEFWVGSLTESGDPAAACSSQIAELHNCYINKKVSASNLRVATLNHGLVSFQHYQTLHKDD